MIEDVSGDFSRPHILVTRQRSDRADASVVFQLMRGMGVAEGMGCGSFRGATLLDGLLRGVLVVAPLRHADLWKSELSQGARP